MNDRLPSLLLRFESLARPTRRQLLWGATVLGTTLALRRALAAEASASPGLVALSPSTARALDAAAARILPSDAGPGAREAQVLTYIDRQVAGPLASLGPALEGVARLLDGWAAASAGGKAFAELESPAQDRVLTALSTNAIPTRAPFPQREAFALLHTLTLEGFLGDPSYGGNAQEVGWRAIQFSTPHRRVREAAPKRTKSLKVVP